MLYLISGQPGNGKSLRAMAEMLEAYERNASAVKDGKSEPRRFFTNVAGATTEENPDAFPWVEKLPEHNDWTKLPDGSYVLYDEAHSDGNTPGLERYGRLFPSTGKPGESDDPRIRAMSTHRHRGFDIVLVTQWPNKIHHQVRTLIGKHIHMNRAMGLEKAGVFTWSRCQPDPYDEKAREKAEEEIWSFPKGMYTRYKSSSLHTDSHKFRIPKKVWSAISMLTVALILAWLGWSYAIPAAKAKYADKANGTAQGEGSLLPPAPPPSNSIEIETTPGVGLHTALNTAAVPTLAGCVASDRGCRCFNLEGFQIDMTERECRTTLDKPLPYNVFHEFREGNPPGQIVDTVAPATGVVTSDSEGSEVFPRSAGYQPSGGSR